MEEKSSERYLYKIAETEDEFQQVHKINYQTFAEEIPQHERNEEGILIDKFHERNTYLIIKKEDEIIGMVCVCATKPFSITQKLENLEKYLPVKGNMFETRLLAVKKEHRGKTAFSGLVGYWYRWWTENGFELTVMSGTLRQMKLYKHLGFIPFGPVVGTKEAPYQPMYLTLDKIREYVEKKLKIK